MFIFSTNLKAKILIPRIKIFCLLLLLLFVTGAKGEPIKKNEVEDLNVIISQIVGGQPNVLFITDLSGSMIRSFGNSQLGNWDGSNDNGTLDVCEALHCGSSCGSFVERAVAAHCAENIANVSVCGAKNCIGGFGSCDTQEQFDNFMTCINGSGALTQAQIDDVLDLWCGDNDGFYEPSGDDICGVNDGTAPDGIFEFEGAAAALDARANLTECSASSCTADDDTDPFDDYACDLSGEYSTFRTCMFNLQAIDINKNANCTGGTANPPYCRGQPAYGSSRLDSLLSVIFDFLDADDSLAGLMCDDTGNLFDGTSSSISCQDYMTTPFRNVRQIVRQDGQPASNRKLPITGASDTFLVNELNSADGDELGVRLRPLTYSGEGNWAGCTNQGTFRLAQGGFAGASEANLRNVWSFFRRQEGSGGTPLAWVLGLDDSNENGTQGGNVINDDTLGAFRVELQSDPSIECRPEFVIILTDGEDTCAGQPSGPSGSGQTTGSITTNANRRSSIQAVSNLRTYYARNPVQNRGQTFKKEVLTFVIGLGIQDPVARRTLNAMALAGGTHTQGIIQHVGPDGQNVIGAVSMNDGAIFPQGTPFDVFIDLAEAKGIDTSPSAAQLQGCKSADRSESGVCAFQGTNIFDNIFFDTGTPFNGTDKKLQKFAFFVNSAEELTQALTDITNFVKVFSTSGVSPTAPQSSTAVALRDRIFLSILTPITTDRLWQGRVALFGFVDVPASEGNKEVIRRPPPGSDLTSPTVVESLAIFSNTGTLNDNAKQFFWEAGKELAERDIVSSARNLFTVKAPDLIDGDSVEDPPFSGNDFDTSGNAIRYTGPLVALDDDANPLNPGQFGISNDDVTDPIPEFCNPPGGPTTQCEGATAIVDCTTVTDSACVTCVKECIRDEIIDFMVGNTEIPTVGDPMGTPSLDSQPSQQDGASPFTSMGYNCPDPEDDNGDANLGSLDTCSVRLGDVFHSNPVVVGSPSPLFFDAGFQQFAVNFKDRSAVVYVGANDGFLHAFHAGEFRDPNAAGVQQADKINPFTLKEEIFPFFSEGTGFELFGVAMPTYLPDSLALPSIEAESPAEIVFGTPPPPDYRTGDFKTFVTDNFAQRSFSDGSPVIGDVFIDGFPNGIPEDAQLCPGLVNTADGQIDLCGREWHTVMLAGSRNGGGAYIALDVTNPACGEDCGTSDSLHEHVNNGADLLEYPKHMWALFDRDFGNTWSTPSMGRIRLKVTDGADTKTVDRWVMFVGGGLDPLDTDPTNGVSFGNAFVVVDISTGKEIFKFHPDRPIPSGASALPNVSEMVCDVPSRITAVDINSDGYTDLAYFGDTCGRMWRFDVSMPIEVSGSISDSGPGGSLNIVADDWTGSVAFCANTDAECFDAGGAAAVPQNDVEAIYFAPTIVLDDLGRRHVIFTTGDRRDPSNVLKSGKLYNLIDDYIPAFLAGGTATGGLPVKTATTLISAGQVIELQAQSGVTEQFISSADNNFTSDQGEFLVIFPSNLTIPQGGEKGFGVPVVINRVLIFTTFAPELGSTNPCIGGTGLGRIFAIDFITGAAALTRIPGVNETEILKGTSDQKNAAAGATVAEGMPTPAQLTFGARGSVLMSVAFTGGPVAGGSQFLVWELPPLPTRTQTLFWEEIL
ncbi:MAG: PilC/PilY family type IV pilus protein [Deltaproteobacteria bacterium]